MSRSIENDPSVVTATFIFNKEGEILFFRSTKYDDFLVLPGGHVDVGETIEEASIRETKEETGLDIKNIEFLKVSEFFREDQFVRGKRHFVGFSYRAEIKDEEQEVILDEKEGSEYFWLKPEDAIKNENIIPENKEVIKEFFVKKKKKKFSKKCKECEKQEEYKAGWIRAQADYKNLQKQISEQRSEWARMSEQTILEEFIPVYDNFKLAFGHQPTDFSNEQGKWAEGIGFIMKQFEKVLQDHGIEEVKTIGEKFDHTKHEAVGEEDVETSLGASEEKESGIIIKQVESGYAMKGKVIKVAKVIVSK